MIAAGEVVSRPASAVKELMENAIDAGATQVSVLISDAGRTLIQVIDNGCGMTPDQAVLCFERHATSKIATAEDLSDIQTFGFRGEALAFIAAVAQVTLKTRTSAEAVGCKVDFADSKHLSTEETACPVGANFSIRDLFYNVPARRKFLKSDNVEFKHIVDEFTRVALTQPQTGFSLSHNGREIYALRPAKSLKFRIQDLMGNVTSDKLVDLHTETASATLSGYICRPDLATKTLGNQFFFVNGRYFRSAYLHKAVMKAYERMIPEGVTPAYFIYIQVDPHKVDVNIHPAKTEVKFEDDSVMFQVVMAAVKETLGRNSFGASLYFDTDNAPEMPVLGEGFEKFHPTTIQPNVEFDPNFNPFEQQSFSMPEFPESGAASPNDAGSGLVKPAAALSGEGFGQPRNYDFSKPKDDCSKLFDERMMPSVNAIVLQGKYILTPVKSGLLMVNIRRATERILYERFLPAVSGNAKVSQAALFPVQIQVGVAGKLIFDEHAALLESLGFDIAPFGNDTLVVNGVPELLSLEQGKVEALMADIMVALEAGNASLPGVMESEIAYKLSRSAAACSKAPSSGVQAQKLIDQLFGCENSEYTIKGLKTMMILSTEDIDKKF